jgi:curved DNA-binding protein CbpA
VDINKNYYDVLGITPSAERKVIDAAYWSLVNKYSPENNIGNAAQARHKLREIKEAYSVLSVGNSRVAYDNQIKARHDLASLTNMPEAAQSSEQDFLILEFWKFAILSTLVVAFFPFSLFFSWLVYGMDTTKGLVMAMVHDGVRTILSIILVVAILAAILFLALAL